jgi:hypothetical protein
MAGMEVCVLVRIRDSSNLTTNKLYANHLRSFLKTRQIKMYNTKLLHCNIAELLMATRE